MYSETVRRLEKFTDSSEFERLGCDILSRLGLRGIEPQGIGKKDGGKDAIYIADDKKTVIHFSLRKDWNKKILEDLERTKNTAKQYNKFVFFSNRHIPPIQRDKLKELCKKKYGWYLDIFDQERIRIELDTNSTDLRKKYIGIEELEVEDTISAQLKILEKFQGFDYSKPHYEITIIPKIPHGRVFKLDKLMQEKAIGKLENDISSIRADVSSLKSSTKLTLNKAVLEDLKK